MNNVNDDLIVINVGNTTYSISSRCPHRGGQLKYSDINSNKKTITFPLHRSVFSLESGEQLFGPKCPNIKVMMNKVAMLT